MCQVGAPLKEGLNVHKILTGSPEVIFQPLPGCAKVKLWKGGGD